MDQDYLNTLGGMSTAERIACLLSGGIPCTDVLVLSHGNIAELKAHLEENQITYEVITGEELLACTLDSGRIERNGLCYGAIVVPFAPVMPRAWREKLDELSYGGVLVFFSDTEPWVDDEENPIYDGMGPVITADLCDLAGMIRMFDCAHFTPSRKYKALRFCHVTREDGDVYLFINTASYTVGFTFEGEPDLAIYLPEENKLYRPECKDRRTRIKIKGGSLLLAVTADDLEALPRLRY